MKPVLRIVPTDGKVARETPSPSRRLNVDWQRVVLNIRNAGLACAQQDKHLDRPEGYTARIAAGEVKRMWFEEGLVLLDLHLALCPEKHRLRELRA